VLILDEPTSPLGVKQAEIVLRHISQARGQGVAMILITHNLHHAIAGGDHFVVLVHGKAAVDFRRDEKTREEILDLMSAVNGWPIVPLRKRKEVAEPSSKRQFAARQALPGRQPYTSWT
jgi:ABC-type sugar transport system ATPase subunit